MSQQICPGLQHAAAQQNWLDSQVGPGELHGGGSQWPPLQNELCPMHPVPHPPQLWGSLSVSTHPPLQHVVNGLHAGEQAAPPELEPLELLDPPELPPLDPELPPEPEPPLEEPLLLPPSFPPLPSTEASPPPPRTSVAPPQWEKTTTTAIIPVAPNK
jgi:hypothetical protein